jgi:cell wall-associated NlpC family hydrolase
LTEKPSGRRRADVEINVLESFELRSRRSIRESERKRKTRAALKAEKRAAKLDRKFFAANPPMVESSSGALIKPAAKVPLRKRAEVKTVVVMSVIAGVAATASLPAYAYSPAVIAISGLASNADGAEGEAQSLAIVSQATIRYERGSFGVMSANDLQRITDRTNYSSYKGLTAFDFASNPKYSELNPDDIMKVAAKYVGVPYILGGELPTGLDCSGYVRLVFSEFGLLLPHSVNAQAAHPRIKRIKKSDARPGDLVIMKNHSHNGIYAGSDLFYHAPRPGDRVKLATIYTDAVYFARVID